MNRRTALEVRSMDLSANDLWREPVAASAETPHDFELPHVPGYEIVRELGRGGTAVIFLARQEALHRLVALKMILAAELAGPDQMARFTAEAEAVARLRHPNIVQIYEVGRQRGRPFLALEYVEGSS